MDTIAKAVVLIGIFLLFFPHFSSFALTIHLNSSKNIECNSSIKVDLAEMNGTQIFSNFAPQKRHLSQNLTICWHFPASINVTPSGLIFTFWHNNKQVNYYNKVCQPGDGLVIYDEEKRQTIFSADCNNVKEIKGNLPISIKTRSKSVILAVFLIHDSNSTQNSVEMDMICRKVDVNTSQLKPRFTAFLPSNGTTIQNERFPMAYRNNSNETWLLKSPKGSLIKFTLDVFQLEDCYHCNCDRIGVYSLEGHVLVEACLFSRFVIKTNNLSDIRVNFLSDASITPQVWLPWLKAGFQLSSEAVLPSNKDKNETTFYIDVKDSGVLSFGVEDYRENVDFIWVITASNNSRIRFIKTIYWIEHCTWCNCDFLAVSDDFQNLVDLSNATHDDHSAIMAKDCGESSYTTGSAMTTANQLFVRFRADSSVGPPQSKRDRSGFEIWYKAVPNTLCQSKHLIKNQSSGTITNFEYPSSHYNKNVRCKWLIVVDYGSQITLNVTTFNIDTCNDDDKNNNNYCNENCDHIKIIEANGKVAAKICKSNRRQFFMSKTNKITVDFSTDSSEDSVREKDKLAGFQVDFEQKFSSRKFEAVQHVRRHSTSSPLIVLLLIISSLVFLTFVAISIFFGLFFRKSKKVEVVSLTRVSSNNYINPSSDFFHLLRQLGKDDLIEQLSTVHIDPDRLEIDDAVVGLGSFGVVSKGCLHFGEFCQIVAVKTLKSGQSSDIVDFLNEALLMKTFDHKNVLRLLGIAVILDQPRVIVPFMANGNLRDFLRNAHALSYTPTALIGFCDQICCGMEYLSANACIHRDLACRNVLISSEFTLKIADFGLARCVRDAKNGCYKFQGGKQRRLPVRWHPPESVMFGTFETKSDVWSFGIVMWEIFSRNFFLQVYCRPRY